MVILEKEIADSEIRIRPFPPCFELLDCTEREESFPFRRTSGKPKSAGFLIAFLISNISPRLQKAVVLYPFARVFHWLASPSFKSLLLYFWPYDFAVE
jgi:hypothetical protein